MTFRPRFRRRRSLLGAAQEDPSAFGDFYDAHADALLAFFVRRVLSPDVAFDLTAETFAIALERLTQFRGTTSEEEAGWLYAIARSQLSRYWRRQQVERDASQRLGIAEVQLSGEDFDRIEALLDAEALRPALGQALSALPVEQARAVTMRAIEDLGYSEIAAREQITEPAARARVSRGLRALGAALAAHRAADEDEAVA